MIKTVLNKFNRSIIAVIATTAMLTAGMVPSGALAAASSNNALYVSASYNKHFTLGSPFNGSGTAQDVSFSSDFYAIDLASHVGETITYLPTTVAPAGTTLNTNANVNFYNSTTNLDWQHQINQQSTQLYASNSTYSTPTSMVIPAGAVAMDISFTTYFMSTNANSINVSSISPSIGYTVKYNGVTQSVSPVASASAIPSTGLVSSNADNLAWINGITGGYTTDSDVTSETVSMYTCINSSSVSNSTVLTAQGKNGGSNVSGISYRFANWDDYTTSTNQWSTWKYDSLNSAVATLSSNTFSGVAGGSQIVVQASFNDYNQQLAAGTRSWDLAVVDGSSQDLTVPCVLPTPTEAPTIAFANNQISVTAPTWASNGGSWKYGIYAASDSAMSNTLYSGTGYGSSSANVYSISSLPASTPLVARYMKSTWLGSTSITSTPGAASNTVTLPAAAITVTSQISNGDNPGEAKLLTQNNQLIDYSSGVTASNQMPTMFINDGNQGFLTVKVGNMGAQTLYHINSSGVDQTFGGNAPGITLSNAINTPGVDPYAVNAAFGWYGARNKWVAAYALDTTMNPQALTDYHDSFVVKTGTFGSASVTTTTLSETAMNNFCDAQVDGSRFTGSAYEVLSSPMAKPLVKLNCDVTYDGMYSFTSATILASITTGSSPAITAVYKFNNGGSNDKFGGFPRYLGASGGTYSGGGSVSAYPNATAATDVALAFYAVTATSSGTAPAMTGTLSTVKLVRVKMNGTTTVTADPVTIPDAAKTVTNQSSNNMALMNVLTPVNSMLPTLPAMSGGSSLIGLKRFTVVTNNTPVTTWKVLTLNNGTGVFDAGQTINMDNDSAYTGTQSFAWITGGQVVNGTGKVLLQRYSSSFSNGVNTYVRGQASLDLSSMNLDSGEAITYTQPSTSGIFTLMYLDTEGRMNMLATMDTKKFGWIRWNSTTASGDLPAGVTVTGQDSLFATAVTGGKLTITGTGLGTVSAVAVDGNNASIVSKAATKLVINLPKNLSGSKAISATFPQVGNKPLGINITYIAGSAKQSQTIDDTADGSATWSGVGSKYTKTFPATTSVGLPTTIKVDKAAICSVSGQTVTMNASGTCVVTVASAGDLGTAATSNTTTIVVAKRDKGNVNAIVSAVTAAAGAWTGTNVTATIPALLTSIGLNATVTVAPAAVCTLSGAVLTIKAAGTCAVSVAGAADAGTDAIAKTVTNVVVTKGDLALEVDATVTVTNNPADSDNTVQLDPGVANGAAGIVDFTYASSNEDICTVDENGVVTGVAVGTCTITTDAEADNNWLADEATTTVTVEDSDTTVDVLPEVGDGLVAPKPVTNNKSAFVPTNDSNLLVKWDKAAGLLTLQSKGVYIGFIKAEITFTKDGTQYTCTNVFGTTAKLASKTAAQKKASLKTKVYTATAAACKDTSKLSVPGSITAPADFAKIAKAAKTAPEKAAETVAFGKLKNFVGNMTIKVTRYRAWPTTMLNKAGHTSTGKGIPATVRTTVISLQ